ncbi:gliding motility-associated C-terminal domain-containing protein [Hymenobacter edaphi]|uniref:Gliding motility-associated C-terminal domain-containing protein n=1 Tax=Hymenobacter edaphi TaxID=2211146 RepID=A0A328B6R5_9BACT|nr:gliding motility-associated C-terminal domain-containing protein [Hymenobacter edaphi]RAK62091.1 hypothetical protein DLM85_24450 [Hymenobacter edaphi]
MNMLLAGAAAAQVSYVPAAVTGYTADVIANGPGSVASSTTNTVDRGNATVRWCFADSTFVNPAGQRPTRALPASGFFRSRTTPGLSYQMGPSSGNNSLRIDGAGSGVLTLTNPQPCSEVMVLATEGNGTTAPKTFLVTFTDGSIQLFTNVVVPDWFGNGATPAIVVGSRVNRPDNIIDNQPNDPTIYEVRLPLAVANYSKAVQSVTVSKTSTDPVLNVMGISLGSDCLGAPTGGAARASTASVCPGSPVALSLSGNTIGGSITYQWQASTDGGTTFADIAGATAATYTARPTATTQYRARLTCRLQSGTSTPITVTVLPSTAALTYAVPPATPTFCQQGTAAVVTATPAGGRFSSSTGLVIDATTGAIDLAASALGIYSVTYTVTAPCAATATTTVTIAAPPAPLTYGCPPFYRNGPNAVPTFAPAAGSRFAATPTGLVVDAATGVVDLTASAEGSYTVSYTTANGCRTTTSLQVEKAVVYPNVITPNNDGKNDELRLGMPNVTDFSLQVFNRWGKRVYTSKDVGKGWTAGSSAAGVYYYLLEYTNCQGRRESYKNWVEVVK